MSAEAFSSAGHHPDETTSHLPDESTSHHPDGSGKHGEHEDQGEHEDLGVLDDDQPGKQPLSAPVYVNPLLGTVRGDPIYLFRNSRILVRSISLWDGYRNPIVVGIRVTFVDGTTSQGGYVTGSPRAVLDLKPNERITSFVIRAGSYIDQITIQTSLSQRITAGGARNPSFTQRLGNGNFEGFEGTAIPNYITSLATRWQTD